MLRTDKLVTSHKPPCRVQCEAETPCRLQTTFATLRYFGSALALAMVPQFRFLLALRSSNLGYSQHDLASCMTSVDVSQPLPAGTYTDFTGTLCWS